MSPDSTERNVARNYLEWMCDMPWSVASDDHLDIDHAEQVLNEEHFGLNKVKQRIVEFLAVRKLKADMKGSVLCLVGPPGVGKTSFGTIGGQCSGPQDGAHGIGWRA